MSRYLALNDIDAPERRLRLRPPDAISELLGQEVYVRKHRTAIQIDFGTGLSPRLPVSRYYYAAEPPVAIDYRREIRFGRSEVEVKQAAFAAAGVRYLVCDGEGDVESLEAQVRGVVSDEGPEAAVAPEVVPERPHTAPRRRRSS